MSKFRTFLNRAWDTVRGRWLDVYNSVIHYHIGGDEIGISKEYGLLGRKTDLKDPKDWTGKKVYTEPETGEDEVYGFIPTQRREYSRTPFKSTKPGYQPGVRESYSGGDQGSVQSGLVLIDGTVQRRETELREVPTNVFGKTVYQKSRFNISQSTGIVKPLGSPGISKATSRETTFNSLGDDKLTITEAFDTSSNRYVKDTAVVPSWFRDSNDEKTAGRNKSKVATQRDISQVRVMSDWEGGKPKDVYLTDNHPIYSFRNNFKRLPYPILTQSKVGPDEESIRNRVSGSLKKSLSTNTTLPREVEGSTADVFYKIRLGKGKNTAYGYPGGNVVDDSLEYKIKNEEKLGLIPFCITTITPDHRTYLNFPAYLENYDDTYTGDWDSTQYVGRAEKFWGYTGFSREISLSFKVLGRNPAELVELYHRLNRLVGVTAPSYGKTGLFMRGTLASITVGDLLKHKTGIIKNVRLSWERDVPWETDDVAGSGLPVIKDGDNTFRVPYSLSVTLGFTPIEEANVTEDFGSYFAFDYKKVPEPVSQVQENKDKESQLGGTKELKAHHIVEGDMWYIIDDDGNYLDGGMVGGTYNPVDSPYYNNIDIQSEGIPFPF